MCDKLGVPMEEGDSAALMALIDEDHGGTITVDCEHRKNTTGKSSCSH